MATLMPTKDQVLEIGAGILAIRETTQGIRKSLGKEVKRDKAASEKKQGFLRRMFVRKKQQDAEKMIEAKKKKNFMGKGVTAVASAGKSFVERLFGAAGALLVGFLVVNLPKIIEEIRKLVEWLQSIKEWFDGFIDKVTGVSEVIINTVKEWISNIKETFGFEDKKDEIEKQIEKYGEENVYYIDRPRKHRYVYFNAKKKRRKNLIKQLSYPIIDYPKKFN